MDPPRPGPARQPRLLAVSDLHQEHPQNRELVAGWEPGHEDDWLIVAGDVADTVDLTVTTLAALKARFREVVWAPGNHELWTLPRGAARAGVDRYAELVARLSEIGVVTPEDPYRVWSAPGTADVAVVPLFLLYDYSFRPVGTTREAALADAYEKSVVCTDEFLLSPAPFASVADWCHERVRLTERRLDALDPGLGTVLVNHFPLTPEPLRHLRHPEFSLWCGTRETADWARRYRAETVVYGHLHIPWDHEKDGTAFREVSVGYPREWTRRPVPPGPRAVR